MIGRYYGVFLFNFMALGGSGRPFLFLSLPIFFIFILTLLYFSPFSSLLPPPFCRILLFFFFFLAIAFYFFSLHLYQLVRVHENLRVWKGFWWRQDEGRHRTILFF